MTEQPNRKPGRPRKSALGAMNITLSLPIDDILWLRTHDNMSEYVHQLISAARTQQTDSTLPVQPPEPDAKQCS